MQYKRKINGLFFILLVVFFLFVMCFKYNERVFAAETGAVSCPPGYGGPGGAADALGNCCKHDSTFQNTAAGSGCIDSSSGDWVEGIAVGLISTYFCPAGNVRIEWNALTRKCYSPNTTVPGSADPAATTFPEDIVGKVFLKCKTTGNKTFHTGKQSPFSTIANLTKDPVPHGGIFLYQTSPVESIEIDMCSEQNSIFLFKSEVDSGVCICPNDTYRTAVEDQDECTAFCPGGNLYGGHGANACNGAECCEGDQQCLTCVGETTPTGRIYTSLGCIDPTREGIVVWLIRIALILTTAIGVFRFIQASFLIRSGDPEKIKEGQEIVTSAIIALVLVLLSVPLLQFIGVNVLGIFPEGFI